MFLARVVVVAAAAVLSQQLRAEPAAIEPPPRLTGVITSGGIRQAIFAAADDGSTVVVGEGETIGHFTVKAIRAGEAELADGAGRYIIELTPSPALRPQAIAIPAAVIAAVRRERETENDQ